MPSVPALNINQSKVCENSGLKIQQEFILTNLEKDFDEIIELIGLFGKKESDTKLQNLDKKYDKYAAIFQPKIKEAKRVLRNTTKRLDYNAAKC